MHLLCCMVWTKRHVATKQVAGSKVECSSPGGGRMGRGKAKVQIPDCRYGAACTRRDCVYKHPPKPAKSAARPIEKSDKICFAFVAGKCAFGRQCHDKHPDEASCQTIKERYSKIDCQWGRGCRTDGCLYRHPSDEIIGPALKLETKPQPAVYAKGYNGHKVDAKAPSVPPAAEASSPGPPGVREREEQGQCAPQAPEQFAGPASSAPVPSRLALEQPVQARRPDPLDQEPQAHTSLEFIFPLSVSFVAWIAVNRVLSTWSNTSTGRGGAGAAGTACSNTALHGLRR